MKPAADIIVPVSTHKIAIAQARAFAEVARAVAAKDSEGSQSPENLLTYLVNAGLAAELHFKALMIAARGGRVTKGHDLSLLYREFPEFLSDFIEWQYAQLMPSAGWKIVLTALTFRQSVPSNPGSTPLPKYRTFAEAVASSSRSFEDGRYFFEKVQDSDWTVFAYAPDAMDAVLLSLDSAYKHFLAGDFGQNNPVPPQNAA